MFAQYAVLTIAGFIVGAISYPYLRVKIAMIYLRFKIKRDTCKTCKRRRCYLFGHDFKGEYLPESLMNNVLICYKCSMRVNVAYNSVSLFSFVYSRNLLIRAFILALHIFSREHKKWPLEFSVPELTVATNKEKSRD